MTQWTYDISRHSLGEIIHIMNEHGFSSTEGSAEPVLFCDAQGDCFFDEAPSPYEAALKEILNERGQDGWDLVQVTFRERELICFWKKPVA
jgi:hypothetical protein